MKKIVAFTGSLRKKSYNKFLLDNIKKIIEDKGEYEFEIVDLSPIPFYNADVEAEGIPSVVEDFAQKVKNADALFIATPEYNYSLSPALKNAIDWLSRLPYKPLWEKKTGLVSASTGRYGGIRSQLHLRQVFVFVNVFTMNQPEYALSEADKSIDENGNIINSDTNKYINRYVDAYLEFIK